MSRARKNLTAQHPLAEILSPEKLHYDVNLSKSITFSFIDQSTPNLFHPTWEGY